ncbi:MAG: fructosamine kinase, partial [Mycobacterium sp.]|nr:fructosamine kinase [Mycobacterium sp.]
MADFVKHHPDAPTGYFAWEAAGLRWLSSVDGGVPSAQILAVDATSLTLRRLDSVTPSAESACAFG